MRTTTITKKGQVSIPTSIRKIKGFHEGSKIVIIYIGDHIELRPLESMNENMFGALATEMVLARDWNTKEEDELWKDL